MTTCVSIQLHHLRLCCEVHICHSLLRQLHICLHDDVGLNRSVVNILVVGSLLLVTVIQRNVFSDLLLCRSRWLYIWGGDAGADEGDGLMPELRIRTSRSCTRGSALREAPKLNAIIFVCIVILAQLDISIIQYAPTDPNRHPTASVERNVDPVTLAFAVYSSCSSPFASAWPCHFVLFLSSCPSLEKAPRSARCAGCSSDCPSLPAVENQSTI